MPPRASQLDLPIPRHPQPDRDLHIGGRSFYFFDFDDNVMTIGTPIFVFHKESRAEVALSTQKFAQVSPLLGLPGPWQDYEVDLDDEHGSFRRFRDLPAPRGEQPFVEDLRAALDRPPLDWRGPSWEIFLHAVHNQRPLAIITARGHDPGTIERGIGQLVDTGHLPCAPNYLSVLPVSHPPTRGAFVDGGSASIPELKLAAILSCVDTAMQRYGQSPHHRFGMSDDAPENLELVLRAMRQLKQRYPDNAFFVIDSSHGKLLKTEVLLDATESSEVAAGQLNLF